ncbi:hypothetical protein STIAU_0742 [Stigmatella aurantiaca DW4/3-1]|uniref:Uncharacterized protein n=1 Tax=Stigmatella aurantiaca (strain DW4/3-1) TaxID=378806 RepID=Q08YU3_STIAD|nr:hypothetical protein STIAU_0742 [Stigmatella aurantiaca DW4/3-1]
MHSMPGRVSCYLSRCETVGDPIGAASRAGRAALGLSQPV